MATITITIPDAAITIRAAAASSVPPLLGTANTTWTGQPENTRLTEGVFRSYGPLPASFVSFVTSDLPMPLIGLFLTS